MEVDCDFYYSPSVTAYAVPAPPRAVEPFGLCKHRPKAVPASYSPSVTAYAAATSTLTAALSCNS